MPFFAKNLNDHIGQIYGEVGFKKGECVAYVKQVAGAPQTALWRAGQKVFDPLAPQGKSHPHLRAGVAIATFRDGKYPPSNRHAAIFLRYSARGFFVQDQWVGKPGGVGEREIFRVYPDKAKAPSNDPDAFYIIEIK